MTKEELNSMYDEMMSLFDSIRNELRHKNHSIYEQWKAGGLQITDEFVSMYPNLYDIIKSLDDDEEDDDEENDQ
jgi:hypothetical protein